MEAAIIAKLPDTIRPATKRQYANNAVCLYRLLHDGKDPTTTSPAFLNKSVNFHRIPQLIAQSPNLASAHSKYNTLNHATALCNHLGYKGAYKHLKAAVPALKAARDALMTQDGSGEMLKNNGVPYEQLLERVRAELVPEFQRMVKQGQTVSTPEQRKAVIRALIGVLNVIEPPPRGAYAQARVITDEPHYSLMGDGKENLMYVPKGDRGVYFCCNTDKVSAPDRLGPDRWELGADASRAIRDSLSIWPRKFLFARDVAGDEPMSTWSYLHEIGQCFTFGDKVVATNVLRHSVVDWFYKKYPSPSMADKRWLAQRLRHSPHTGEEIYRKVGQ